MFDPTWVLHKTYLITCKLPQYPSEKNVNKSNKISYFNNSIEWLRKNCKSDQEKILKWIALCDDICSKMDMIAKEIIEFSCKWNLCPMAWPQWQELPLKICGCTHHLFSYTNVWVIFLFSIIYHVCLIWLHPPQNIQWFWDHAFIKILKPTFHLISLI